MTLTIRNELRLEQTEESAPNDVRVIVYGDGEPKRVHIKQDSDTVSILCTDFDSFLNAVTAWWRDASREP